MASLYGASEFAYSCPVIIPALRLSTFLRASLLALLVMGVALKPMLASVCEMHVLGHTLAVQAHGHDHAESKPEHAIDHDHARGAHGLLHEDDSGSAYADIMFVVVLPTVSFEPLLVSLPAASPVPLKHISGPFRPPIA